VDNAAGSQDAKLQENTNMKCMFHVNAGTRCGLHHFSSLKAMVEFAH